MKFISDEPKAYKISLYSFLLLIILAIISIPVSQYISSFYEGWGGLGVFAISGIVFIVLLYISGLASFISGLFYVVCCYPVKWKVTHGN